MNVLLVDDEPGILKQAKIFLEKEDERLNIETALSAEEALQKLTINDYDAIVSDYQMQEMDGLDFLETVRKERESNIPFIVFTGKGREEVAMDALNLGGNRYLQKGGDPRSQYGVLARAIIQEIKHAKTMIKKEELEAELSSLVKGSEDPIYIVDENCRVVFANSAELKVHEMESEDMLGKSFRELHEERDAKELEKKVEKVLNTGESLRQEVEHGTHGYFIRTLSPIKNPVTGKVDRVAVISKNITKRKEIEKRQSLLSSSLDQAAIEVYWIAPEGKFVYSNEMVRERLGYTRKELSEMNIWGVNPKHGEEVRKERWDKLKEEKVLKLESEHVTEKGETYPVAVVSHYTEHEGEEYEFAFAKDITKRRKSEEKFQALFDQAPEGVIAHDLNGDILFVNRQACEEKGYSREEFLSKNIKEIDPYAFSDEYQEEYWEKISIGESVRFETVHKRKDGTAHPAEVTLTQIKLNGRPVVVGFDRDISRRKEAEEREEFLHSLLRHDVKNKAQIVKGYLELARDYDIPNELEDYLSKASEATQSGIEIIEKVKTLKEIEQRKKIRKFELCSLLENVIERNQEVFDEKAIELHCQKERMEVQGGPLLEELFSNVIENMMTHADCDTIRISGEESDGEITVKLEDDGKGIPDEYKERIFDRGFRRGKTGGSGLGLYLVKEIAESHGGSIKVGDSELGGARFDVQLQKA